MVEEERPLSLDELLTSVQGLDVLRAEEINWFWENRAEILRKQRIGVIRASDESRKYQLEPKAVGKSISPEKLQEIFGERGRVRIQTFANDLKMRRRWHKFAVSEAPFRFSRNPNMMFFEVGRMQEGEKGVEILYLGTGKTKETPEIGNEFAADSWGFAVLNLRDDLKQKEGE